MNHTFDRSGQLGKVVFYHAPNRIEIDLKVTVNEYVAKS